MYFKQKKIHLHAKLKHLTTPETTELKFRKLSSCLIVLCILNKKNTSTCQVKTSNDTRNYRTKIQKTFKLSDSAMYFKQKNTSTCQVKTSNDTGNYM